MGPVISRRKILKKQIGVWFADQPNGRTPWLINMGDPNHWI